MKEIFWLIVLQLATIVALIASLNAQPYLFVICLILMVLNAWHLIKKVYYYHLAIQVAKGSQSRLMYVKMIHDEKFGESHEKS